MCLASVLSLFFPRVSGRPFPAGTALLAAALSLTATFPVHAQSPGELDPNFLSQLSGGTVYSLFRYDFLDITAIPRDFLVVGGGTTPVTETAGSPSIFGRLALPSGTFNASDNSPGVGSIARIVYTIAQDKYENPDKFFVGGAFPVNGTQATPKQNVVRVNSDFKLDDTSSDDGRPAFDPGVGADSYVTAVLPTADGKVVIGGLFTLFNNVAHQHIVRLTDNAYANGGITDGTIDTTFDPNLALDDNVLTLAEQLNPTTSQPNGQILVGGEFNHVNNIASTKLARLNNDGSLDTSFAPSIDARVNIVTVQPDGKILIGGDFATVNGTAAAHIARLNFDGSLDTTFSATVAKVPPANVNVVSVYTIVLLTDGRMYVGGNFIVVNGVSRQYLALLGADGSVDPTFDPGTNIINAVQAVLPDATTGDVFVGETVSQRINNKYPPSLVALRGPTPNTLAFTNAPQPVPISSFFTGSTSVGNSFYYLAFPNTPNDNVFGYFDLQYYPYIFHDDLGFEYVTDANDGAGGIYLYDFASGSFFYTSPVYAFPYLYDFTLKSTLFYFPVGITNPGHYTTNPRYFFDFATGQIITK